MGEIHSKHVLICSSKHSRKCSYKYKSMRLHDDNTLYKQPKHNHKCKYNFEKDFTVIKQIGAGAYANIYLAKSISTNTTYAIKCINKKQTRLTTPNSNSTSTNNEKRILKSLQHPFILKLHFAFQDDNYIYLATDYLQHKDLHYHIQRNTCFTEDQTKFYLSEVYIAIKYLHSKGIIHRDIKSENIMLTDTGHIILIDFGSAKKLLNDSHNNNNNNNNVTTSSFVGTAECMPPEVIEGKSYSFEFDWWSFGVLMYEMIYGYVPFRDVYQDGVLDLVLHSEPTYHKYVPCADKRIKVSNETIDLMKRLLQKNPLNRIDELEIPQHPFFKGINFDNVESCNVEPPRLVMMGHSQQLM